MTDSNAHSTEQASRLQDGSAVQLRLPSFWPQETQVWFHQVEAQFSLCHIASETTRYYNVAPVLPP